MMIKHIGRGWVMSALGQATRTQPRESVTGATLAGSDFTHGSDATEVRSPDQPGGVA